MAVRLRERSYMGQRLIYQWDLLVPERRRRYEQAAARNGLRLSKWLREVVDAAAERRPVDETPTYLRPVTFPIDDEDEQVAPHEHVLKRTPWGGRVCEGCGDLL